MSVRTSARPRSWRRRIGTALAGLVAAAGIVIIPASPAQAIQTIAWITAPPTTATLGQSVSFAWFGTANTFLGARITGCFANFPDGNNYSNQFGGNFTSGNCSYTNRVINVDGSYTVTVGFTLSTGGQMTQQWHISVGSPSPTLIGLPTQVNLTASDLGGGVMPPLSVYGSDNRYGNYPAACTPATGASVPVGTSTGSCTATNPAGKSTTATFPLVVTKGDPVIDWNLPASVPYGTTFGQLPTATVSPVNLTGQWVYENSAGDVADPSAVLPVGTDRPIAVTFVPSGPAASSFNSSRLTRTITVYQTAQSVSFGAGTPTSKTYGDPPFSVSATGTPGGGQVSIAPQPGNSCTVGSVSGTTSVTAQVTITDAGPCVLLANQAATSEHTAAPSAQWSVTVLKHNTSTSWATPDALTYGQPLADALNATGTVPGSIVYRNVVTGAVVTGATVLDAGTYSLRATFTPTDQTHYTGSTKGVELTVDKAAADLTAPAPADRTYGDAPFSLSATSSSPAAIGVTATGACASVGQQITINTAGECTVAVVQASTANYLAASLTRTLTVAKAPVDLAWGDPEPITYGTPLDATQLNAAVPGDNPPAGAVAYTLPNGDDASGAVLGAGNHDVTATWTPIGSAAQQYRVATRTTTVHVDKAAPTITWDNPADIPFQTALSDDQLQAHVDGAPGTIAYTLDNGTDARAAILGAGKHRLTATFTPDDADNVETVSQQVWITVTRLSQDITWDLSGRHTLGDAPFELAATGGGSGNPVRFRTESTACSVDGNAVTILHAGDCTITANQDGSDDYWAAEPTARSVTVAKTVPAITWRKPAGITYGDALGTDELNATVTPNGATGTVAYTLANGNPADGALLPAGDDQVLVATFTPDDATAGDYESVTTSVSIHVAKAGQAIDFADLADATYGDRPVALRATGGGSGTPVTFKALGDCSLDDGEVRLDSAGTCRVTADQAGDADHEAAASVTREFAIAKATQHLSLAPVADRTWGARAFQAEASAGASDAPVLLSADGACSVWDTTVTLVGTGTCTLTATQSGDRNHLAAEPVSRSFSIGKAALSVAALPATKAYGAQNPALGYTVDGLVAGDTEAALTRLPTCTTAATASTHVGTAPITCSGADGTNYAITYIGAALAITKAPLTQVGPTATKFSGTPNPTLEPSFTGFVNGDGTDALDSTGTCTTTASTSSPVGVYPIACSGASAHDYDITSLPGSLSVTPGYSLSAFQSPVVDGYTVKKGSTVPVKFTLLDSKGNAVPASVLELIANTDRATAATRTTGGGPLAQQGAFKLTGDHLHLNLATGALPLGSNEVVVTVKAAVGSVMAIRSFTLVVR